MGQAIRILLAKVGFDGHDRGVKVLAAVFRDAGHDVIYLGKYLTPDQVAAAALEEDVEVIGLSFLGGAHLTHCRETLALLAGHGLDDIVVIAGGVIPHKDRAALEALGVDAVFPANTDTRDILAYLDARFA
jgi:methylmalonyl-CoA mutase C-terminal domain/subunit